MIRGGIKLSKKIVKLMKESGLTWFLSGRCAWWTYLVQHTYETYENLQILKEKELGSEDAFQLKGARGYKRKLK